MHLTVEGDVLDDFAAIGLEGGTKVVDVDAAEDGHEPVGCARGNAAEKEVVGALGSPAADDVVAFFEFCEEGGDLVGIVLEVAIHCEDVVSLGVVEAGGEGGGLAEVAAELDDENAGVHCGDLFEEAVGAIAGPIVDEDEFEGFADLLHDGLEAVVEGGDVLLLVMKRNDDGIFRHELMILLWRLNVGRRCEPRRFAGSDDLNGSGEKQLGGGGEIVTGGGGFLSAASAGWGDDRDNGNGR